MPLIERNYTIHIQDKIIATINRLAEEMKNGDEIIYEPTGSTLWSSWRNIRTNERHIIRLIDIKKLAKIMYIPAILSFVKNEINAVEAQNYINKIPKLKAFL